MNGTAAALHAALTADAALMAMLAQGTPHPPVYQDVPQPIDGQAEARFPYLSLGPATVAPFNDKGALGATSVAQVNVWTRELGYSACNAIADRVRLVLDRAEIAVPGLISCDFLSAEFSMDPDGKTRRGLMMFRITWLE